MITIFLDTLSGYIYSITVRRKGPLTRQAIGQICTKWGRTAGLYIHPHQLRHNYAKHAVQRGVDMFILLDTLDHSSSATTGHYVVAKLRESSSLPLVRAIRCWHKSIGLMY